MARAHGFTCRPFWAAVGRDGMLLHRGCGPSGEAEIASTLPRLAGR